MNAPTTSVEVIVNGQPHTVPAGQPLTDLLTHLGLPPQAALVEYNGHALLRAEWPEIRLTDGDRLEVFRVVAGG